MIQEAPTSAQKIAAAVFYGTSSLAIMFVNKVVLTSYGFPSFTFLAASQAAFTVIALRTLHLMGKIKVATLTRPAMRALAPLVVISFINVTSGLAGTKRVNMPMFTVLRRFAVLITMLLERILLHVTPSTTVQASVALMIGGSILAAANDLSFDLQGYLAVMLSNLFTALNGVVMKGTVQTTEMSNLSILHHISIASMWLMLATVYYQEDEAAKLRAFEHWGEWRFMLAFTLASAMGSVLNYSIFLCTTVNSALTTSVVGNLKNILSTYLGMLLFSDYIFSVPNFVGLNISIAGTLIYGYAEIRLKQKVKETVGSPREVCGTAGQGKAKEGQRCDEELRHLVRASSRDSTAHGEERAAMV